MYFRRRGALTEAAELAIIGKTAEILNPRGLRLFPAASKPFVLREESPLRQLNWLATDA